nr:hypothetical protein [Pseudoxanthomonas spadix]
MHAASLASLSPQTLARLRNARQASGQGARRSRSLTWLGATACTMLLAVLAASQLLPPRQHGAPAGQMPTIAALPRADEADAFVSTAEVLDQNPDLYLWLGSDAWLAME